MTDRTWDPSLDRITGTDAEHLGLDEIVASNVDFHMERMSDDHMWFALYFRDGSMQHVHLQVQQGGRLKATVLERELR